MPARKPLDYQPQSARIFRPREEVEQELQHADDERKNERTEGQTNEQTNEEQAEALALAPSQGERRAVRHSFDIYADQLQALGHIQLARWNANGKKPKMGTLVQEALDAYIQAQARPKTNERRNER